MFIGDGQLLFELQLEQTEQQKSSLEEQRNEMQQLQKHLEERLADSENARKTEEEISKELQKQVEHVLYYIYFIRLDYGKCLILKGSQASCMLI